jgi:hypothetical protein
MAELAMCDCYVTPPDVNFHLFTRFEVFLSGGYVDFCFLRYNVIKALKINRRFVVIFRVKE